jgi:hypothetical protein
MIIWYYFIKKSVIHVENYSLSFFLFRIKRPEYWSNTDSKLWRNIFLLRVKFKYHENIKDIIWNLKSVKHRIKDFPTSQHKSIWKNDGLVLSRVWNNAFLDLINRSKRGYFYSGHFSIGLVQICLTKIGGILKSSGEYEYLLCTRELFVIQKILLELLPIIDILYYCDNFPSITNYSLF